MPAAARSRSAAAVTITGFLPPISQIAGFGYERSERADDRHPHGARAGERHPVDARVPDQRLAGAGAAGQQVHDAARHACRDEGVDDEMTAERSDRRRLDDHGVAGDQGGTGRTGDERRRVVERGDHRPHPVRSHHVGRHLAVAEAQHRHLEAAVLGHRVGVVADQVGGLLDLADRLEPRLAVLPGEGRTVDDGALGDQIGGAVEHLDALDATAWPPRLLAPTSPRPRRRRRQLADAAGKCRRQPSCRSAKRW